MREPYPFQRMKQDMLNACYASERYQLFFKLARVMRLLVLECRAPNWNAQTDGGECRQAWHAFQFDEEFNALRHDDCKWYSEGVIAHVGIVAIPPQDRAMAEALMQKHPAMEYRWVTP